MFTKNAYNFRELVKIEADRITINEDDLDLFQYYDRESIPNWEPKANITEYSKLNSIFFDIETDGGVLNGDSNLEKINSLALHSNNPRLIFKEVFKREPKENDEFIVKCIFKYFKGTLKPIDEMLLNYGVNPINHKIVLIGLINEKNQSVIINCTNSPLVKSKVQELLSKNKEVSEELINLVQILNAKSEKVGLEKFCEIILKKNPDIMTGFNCFKFDLPFIIKRCELLGVKHPFYINFKREVCQRSAQRFGKPATYQGIWFNRRDKGECAIIDLYNQVLAWDFVARKLTAYSLKQSCLQTGLRKTQRTELSFEEMLECINQGELTSLSEYLFYDLEDTKLLGDFLIPSIYFQKLFLPKWHLQSLSHSGNGSKWNDILKTHYIRNCKPIPETSPKCSFVGGLTGANAGVFENVSKIDVASLYPNIMLTYGIYSEKDDNAFMLQILNYLLKWRLKLKDKKNLGTATSEEKRTEAAFKVIINSGYGALGTGGINFNDYVAAALVTAHGRAILKLMVNKILENGGKILSIDTDGVYYSTNDSTFQKNYEIYQKVQESLPKGITIEYELEAKLFYTPPVNAKKLKALEELEQNITEGVINDGLKKNYIIISWKNLKDKDNSPLVIKCKGKFVKRDRCKLEKEFQPELLRIYCQHGLEKAKEYFESTVDSISNDSYNLDGLKITRKIRVGEKKMIEHGEPGEVISYYRGFDTITYHKKTGKPNKKKIENWIIDGEINKEYYINLVTIMYTEVLNFL